MDNADALAFIEAWDSGNYSSFIFEFSELVGSAPNQSRDIYQVQIHRTFATIPQTHNTEFQAPWAWTYDEVGPFKILIRATGAIDTITLNVASPVIFETASSLRMWGVV